MCLYFNCGELFNHIVWNLTPGPLFTWEAALEIHLPASEIAKRGDPKSSHHKVMKMKIQDEGCSLNLLDDHFTQYVCQSGMLCTLNLSSDEFNHISIKLGKRGGMEKAMNLLLKPGKAWKLKKWSITLFDNLQGMHNGNTLVVEGLQSVDTYSESLRQMVDDPWWQKGGAVGMTEREHLGQRMGRGNFFVLFVFNKENWEYLKR